MIGLKCLTSFFAGTEITLPAGLVPAWLPLRSVGCFYDRFLRPACLCLLAFLRGAGFRDPRSLPPVADRPPPPRGFSRSASCFPWRATFAPCLYLDSLREVLLWGSVPFRILGRDFACGPPVQVFLSLVAFSKELLCPSLSKILRALSSDFP